MHKLKPNQFYLPCGALITELPILFQTEMVKAILKGRKTQTRRTRGLDSVNADPNFWSRKGNPMKNTVRLWGSTKESNPNPLAIQFGFKDPIDCITYIKSTFGKPGDLLCVREKFTPLPFDMVNQRTGLHFSYFADCDAESLEIAKEYGFKWKPSIHMPKDAARIWLMIEDIRVERVQEISEEDAKAEGIEEISTKYGYDFDIYKDYKGFMPDGYQAPRFSFKSLWISINGEESWNANPWVWVIKYRILSKTGKPSLEVIEQNYRDVIASASEAISRIKTASTRASSRSDERKELPHE